MTVLDMTPGNRERFLSELAADLHRRLSEAPKGLRLPDLLREVSEAHGTYEDDVLLALSKLDIAISGVDTVTLAE
ncbi:hypothetical protein [Geodermatophilus sp. URMC 65]